MIIEELYHGHTRIVAAYKGNSLVYSADKVPVRPYPLILEMDAETDVSIPAAVPMGSVPYKLTFFGESEVLAKPITRAAPEAQASVFEASCELYVYGTPKVIVQDVFRLEHAINNVNTPSVALVKKEEISNLEIDAEAHAPSAALVKKEEISNLEIDAEAHAPKAITCSCDFTEILETTAKAEPCTPAVASLEGGGMAAFIHKATAKASASTVLCGSGDTELFAEIIVTVVSATVVVAESEIYIDGETNAWLKPTEWTDPELANNVLGITQSREVVPNGNIIKIY